jgi:hypothetical protein
MTSLVTPEGIMTPGQRTDSSLFFELRKHLKRKGDIKIGHHVIGIQMEMRDRYLIRINVARNNAIRWISPQRLSSLALYVERSLSVF